MASSDVCPPEDAVKAFIELLVDPKLPSEPTRDKPSLSEQQEVAKQVRSVVLLYNYYHRKQHPELAFLAFDEFCKLAVDLKPTLSEYIKSKQIPDEMELVHAEEQPSLTEKEILNACNLSARLDASKNVPNIEGWPITKVAVLLIDNKMEHCFLNFGSTTQGVVWSMVEKDVDTSTQNCQVTTRTLYTYKKRRSVQKTSKSELNVNEDGFLQAGYAAVKEAAGVNKTDITLLGSYTVYSQSKEKTASRFYIMKCSQTQLANKEFTPIPIKDLIERLRGPLVQRSSSSWIVTSVVEYFHILPYSKKISEWISRETSSNSLQASKLAEKTMMVESPEVTELYASSKGLSIGLDNQPSCDTTEALNQREISSNSLHASKLAETNMMVESPEVTELYASSEGLSIGLDNKPSCNTTEALNQRETSSNSLHASKLAEKNMMVESPEVTELYASSEGLSIGLDNKPSCDTTEPLNQRETSSNSLQASKLAENNMMVESPEVTELYASSEGLSIGLDNQPSCDTTEALNQRETSSNSLQASKLAENNMMVESPEVTELYASSEGLSIGLDNQPSCDTTEALNQRETSSNSPQASKLAEKNTMVEIPEVTELYVSSEELSIGLDKQPSCDTTEALNQRETSSNSLQDSKLTEKNMMVESPKVTELYVSSEGLSIGLDNQPSCDTTEALNQRETSSNSLQASKLAEKNMMVESPEMTELYVSSEGLSIGLIYQPSCDTTEALNHRETSSNCLQVSKLAEKNMMVESPEVTELYVSSEGLCIGLDNQPSCDATEALNQKENNGCKEVCDMDVENYLVLPPENIEEFQHIDSTLQVIEDQEIEKSAVQHNKMASSNICPPEDAVRAFIEFLVDPMLPSKSTRDNPSLSQQQDVAKQVRSVVLLYNYYHRKQHPELAFLPFDEFCKLAVDLKPTLSAHIKSKKIVNEIELVDVDKQLSLTEREILNACNICACLDASKNVPDIEGWPISKVAVLLMDNRMEHCFMHFGSITQGVWSMVEKDVDNSAQNCEVTTGTVYTYKKRRSVQKTSKCELNVDEGGRLQAGYAAVKEAAGVNKTDITLLGSYTVYSQSKENTASRFYIMKCSQTQLTNKEFTPIPIKDLIERLRGPLVQRSSSSWIVTSVAEYFHMLPYSKIISEWISRETSSYSLQASKMAEKNMMEESPEVTQLHVSSEGLSTGLDNQPSCDTIEALNPKENSGCKEVCDMDVENSLVLPPENIEECQNIYSTLQVIEDREIENSSVQHNKMASSDVCLPEDAVKAFIELLVDPMLPPKPTQDNPSLSEQQNVANQVRSVVLLYNYYHRKQHPELAFLAFEEFCKLVVDLNPTLSAHIKPKQIPDEMELVDADVQPSLTEKEILNACKLCACLDASKNVPDIEGWPISKVAVLLIDNKNENCYLNFGTITQGVWSMVEKDLEISAQSCEVSTGTQYAYKKRRLVPKTSENESNVGEDRFLQAGYAAVKEVAGVNKTDIMLLESYTVYSQSKEKTASRFYIMKCSQTQLINKEFTPFPIKDLIESLRGPLILRSSSSWIVTSVVDYFHMLPYSEIISEWISRETSSNSLQGSKLAEKNMMAESPEVTELYVSSEGLSIGLDNQPRCDTTEALNQKEINGCKEASGMDVDNSLFLPPENIEECQHIANNLQVIECKEVENSSVPHYSNGSRSPVELHDIGLEAKKVDSMIIAEGGIKDPFSCDKICANTALENNSTEEGALIAKSSNSDLEKLQILIASKGKTLSQTALNALIRKRNALALQHRMIEDEIALCDMKIQRMRGGEDDLELKIDSIIEGCNDTWVRNQGRMCPHLEDQCLPPYAKRKRLTEAVLGMQSPCQELDGVCHENNWILPTYRISQSDSGFQANLTVKGPDFERSCGGSMCSHPREARESAAAQMLVNLRSMARSAQ